MDALMAPNSLSNLRRPLDGRPGDELLKLKTSTWGRSRLRHYSRCERMQGWDDAITPCTRHACEFRHPAWLMLQPERTCKCRLWRRQDSDQVTTALSWEPDRWEVLEETFVEPWCFFEGCLGPTGSLPGRPGVHQDVTVGLHPQVGGTFSGAGT